LLKNLAVLFLNYDATYYIFHITCTLHMYHTTRSERVPGKSIITV
jgi:hypothetical protein